MRKWIMIVGAAALAFSLGLEAAPAASTKAARSAASIDCSKQADAKGLHGQTRRAFRDKCKMASKSSAKSTTKAAAKAATKAATKSSAKAPKTTGQR